MDNRLGAQIAIIVFSVWMKLERSISKEQESSRVATLILHLPSWVLNDESVLIYIYMNDIIQANKLNYWRVGDEEL